MKVLLDDTQIVDKEFMDRQIKSIREKNTGILTGFIDLDYQWGGLKQGDTYLIAARPAMGKTAFILNMILHMTIKDGEKVALFSLESSKEQLINRMWTMDAIVEGHRLRSGKLDEDEWRKIIESAERIANSNLVINDTCGLDIDDLDNELSTEAMSDVKVVFIDYLQLLNTEHVGDNRKLETYYICERIKQIAIKHNVAIVVLSQLSKVIDAREDHRPVLSDFAYKDTPNYFDNVSFIYRDEYYNYETEDKGIAEIITARNKRGSRGVVILAWIPEYQRFCNLEKVDCWDDEEEGE